MNSDNLTSPDAMSHAPVPAGFRESWKILLGSLIGTLFANILCLPLWTDYDVESVIRTLFNRDAHMDIIYSGPLTGANAFYITSPEPELSTFTNYRYGSGAQFYATNLHVGWGWKTHSFTLNARRKGYIQILLRGPHRYNDYGEIYPITTDYSNLKIRGKEIFSDRRKVTYTKDFSYRIPVNANEAINISFDVRRHHFDADDCNLGKTKNYWYITTLNVLAFVIFYILLQRLSISYRRAKAGDAVFVFIFFLILMVPLSNISDAPTSVRELRTLKQRPKVSLILKEGTQWGKEYDDWFCDHLGGREWLIKLHDVMQREIQEIIRGPVAWYMQRNGWVFDSLKCQYQSSNDLNNIVKTLVGLREFCEMNHIKLYVFVVPKKESIYQEQLYVYGMDKRAEEKSHEQIKQLAAKQHVTYIFPWAELRDARKVDYVFFKLAHHWTDWGAYIGYRALMKEIRRDFPNIPIVSLEDYHRIQSCLIRDEWDRRFHSGNLIRFFGFERDSRCPAALYNYYKHKNADKLVLNMGKFMKDYSYGGGGTQNHGDWNISK